MKKNLVITGASGFLGYHLVRLCAPQWNVYALSRTAAPGTAGAGVTAVSADVTNYIELGNLLEDIEPDAVIHAAAIADANYCQQHPTESHAVNVEAAQNIAGLCSDYGVPLLFTSTDLVFNGQRGNYTEEDEVNPLSLYGQQKAQAEEAIARIYPNATIARLPLMAGQLTAGKNNYLRQLITQLQNGQSAPLFTNEYRSACGALSVCKGLLHVMGTPGIIHIAGAEKVSRYQLGQWVAATWQLNPQLLHPCLQTDVKMAAPRPPDVSLNISKAVALGYAPLALPTELQQIATHNYC